MKKQPMIILRGGQPRKTAYTRAANAAGMTLADWCFKHLDAVADLRESVRIGVVMEHKKALAIYTDAGNPYPYLPEGKDTLIVPFVTTDGQHAVIVNQGGFTPEAADNEDEVNGCLVAVVLDDVPEAVAKNALEKWISEMMEL